jgi:hypothetical protein
MRTVSSKYSKGQEPPRTWRDDLRTLRYIVSAALNYLIVGRKIRKVWHAKQRAREKYYLDES